MTLNQLSKLPANTTDKGDVNHSFHGQSYLDVYEPYFSIRRNRVRKVLEIGVNACGSVRLWRDYFPKAEIHGMDIDPASAACNERRITVHTGDQYNTVHLALIAKSGPFDIIIDDGSHVSVHIATSFEALWPSVTSGGLYCIEDTRCTYDAADPLWPGMLHNEHIPKSGDRFHIDNLVSELIKTMDNLAGDVRSIHFHPMQIIIEKL